MSVFTTVLNVYINATYHFYWKKPKTQDGPKSHKYVRIFKTYM